ncbi:hypothetical protein B0H16DRAFT_1812213 [Mycena metata]|uniref:Uncharacterized protein n=1 Tax=Mycena metata TaxID=1033252 RepID=A0AAD7NG66_9AGAR|nr:hypothetical protein B0H16DRAFT_1812213 [Mycena metata]
MINEAWKQLPLDIKTQVSPNHTDWRTFCDSIAKLQHGKPVVPTPLPIPWHQLQDSAATSVLPYKIGALPSQSGLVVRLTRQMPVIYRCKPDRKMLAALDPDSADALVEDSEADDDDEVDNDETDKQNKTRFLWPQHPQKVAVALSNQNQTPGQAFEAAGMQLKQVHYHPRMLILDLSTCVLEIEPLLHSSPQIFSLAQWEGVCRVPREERGYKIGFAIVMTSHVLALLSNDNLWRLFWRSGKEFKQLQRHRVPDSVLSHHEWCKYHAQYLEKNLPKARTQLMIYQWLMKPGPHPFQGSGRYCSAEILALAGIPAWTSAYDVLTSPILYGTLVESDSQFHHERLCLVE